MNRLAPDIGVARACRVMNLDRSMVYRQTGEQYGTIAGIRPIGGATSPIGRSGNACRRGGRRSARQSNRPWARTRCGHCHRCARRRGGGNQIGQNMGEPAGYRVDIQLSDGSMRSLDMQTPGDLRPGDRVRIDGDQISRY